MLQRILAIPDRLVGAPGVVRLAGPALIAFAVGAGIVQLQASLPDGRWLAGLVAVSALLAIFLGALWRVSARWSSCRYWLWAVAALAAGFAYSAWRAELRLADELPLAWERRDISITGVIAELPREFERGQRFLFVVDEVVTPGARLPEKILLSWYRGVQEDQTLPERRLQPGERWRFTVRLKRPHGHVNPGGFDYEAWLLERGVRATGYVRAAPAPALLGPAEGIGATLRYGIERSRWKIRDNLQKNLPDAAWTGIVVALAIGDQGSMPADAWRVFAATGTTHLMSISGLHVTMLAALAGLLTSSLWRRIPLLALRLPAQRAGIAMGWLAALFYTLLAGAGIPALRTLLMLSVAAAAHGLSRSVPVTRVLSLALAAVLLFDPWAVLAVGFWLSFGAVAVLLLLVGDPDRQGDATADHGGWLVERLRRWGLAQWAVTLGTLPMLLWIFQQFSLVSPLANALAIPVVSMLVSPLCVAAGLLPLPWLAVVAEWPLQGLMGFLIWLADQPWALWRQAQPPLWAVLLASFGIVLHLLPGPLLRWRWRFAALVLVLPVLLPQIARPETGEAEIDVLDVGHGLAAIIRTHSHTLLFDGGPRYSADSDAGERIIVPVARAAGIGGFSGVVLSHQDTDHSGGIESARREIPFGWFASSIPPEHRLRAGFPEAIRCQRGQRFEWDGVRFEFLSPPAEYYVREKISTNRLSCVLLIVAAGGRSMLLTADAEAPEEAAMLASLADRFPVDVVQVPHQGSRSSSSEAFVRALSPRVAIIPAGYRNPFGHPHPDVVERYRAVGTRLYQTDIDGAVRIRLGAEVSAETARSERPRYWYGR